MVPKESPENFCLAKGLACGMPGVLRSKGREISERHEM